jgi:hypothetical protein
MRNLHLATKVPSGVADSTGQLNTMSSGSLSSNWFSTTLSVGARSTSVNIWKGRDNGQFD